MQDNYLLNITCLQQKLVDIRNNIEYWNIKTIATGVFNISECQTKLEQSIK